MRKIGSVTKIDVPGRPSPSSSVPSSQQPKIETPMSPDAAAQVRGDVLPPPPPTAKRYEPSRRDYGIEEAIQLMRKLPPGDLRTQAAVIKECLESTNIKICNIIKDAEIKEGRLEEQVKKLDAEIENLESMIAQRQDAINILRDDLEETRRVKNSLGLAEGSHEIEIDIRYEESRVDKSDLQREQSTSLLLDSLFGEVGDDEKTSIAFKKTPGES